MSTKVSQADFKTKPEKLAKDIISYLLQKDMIDDTLIYVGGKRYFAKSNSWDEIYYDDNMNPKDYCEYAGDILSISTEGFLYDALNYGFEWGSKVPDELDVIFKKHGYYYEMCTSWFLTAVKL